MKDNPMQSIKHGLAFVFGTLYASCWWASLSFWNQNELRFILPWVGAIVGSMLIAAGTLWFFVKHW